MNQLHIAAECKVSAAEGPVSKLQEKRKIISNIKCEIISTPASPSSLSHGKGRLLDQGKKNRCLKDVAPSVINTAFAREDN